MFDSLGNGVSNMQERIFVDEAILYEDTFGTLPLVFSHANRSDAPIVPLQSPAVCIASGRPAKSRETPHWDAVTSFRKETRNMNNITSIFEMVVSIVTARNVGLRGGW